MPSVRQDFPQIALLANRLGSSTKVDGDRFGSSFDLNEPDAVGEIGENERRFDDVCAAN
jgi:hypothetical protein